MFLINFAFFMRSNKILLFFKLKHFKKIDIFRNVNDITAGSRKVSTPYFSYLEK